MEGKLWWGCDGGEGGEEAVERESWRATLRAIVDHSEGMPLRVLNAGLCALRVCGHVFGGHVRGGAHCDKPRGPKPHHFINLERGELKKMGGCILIVREASISDCTVLQ